MTEGASPQLKSWITEMRKIILAAIILIAATLINGATSQKAEAQFYIGPGGIQIGPGAGYSYNGDRYRYRYDGRYYNYRYKGRYYANRRRHCSRRPGWYDRYDRWHRGRRVCSWRYY